MKQNSRSKEEQEEALMNAFGVFDKLGTGLVKGDELRKVLGTLGDSLSDTEIDELIKEGTPNTEGQINYTSTLYTLYTQNDTYYSLPPFFYLQYRAIWPVWIIEWPIFVMHPCIAQF